MSDRNLVYTSIHKLHTDDSPRIKEHHVATSLHVPFLPVSRFDANNDYHCQIVNNSNNFVSLTFEQVTDNRAQSICQQAQSHDLPIIFYWSGGIDSTLFLAAAINNFDQYTLNRVKIKMDKNSYFENPWFFNNVIKKNNLSYTDASINHNNAVIVHGFGGDALWGDSEHAFASAQLDARRLNQDPVKNPSDLLRWLNFKFDNMHSNWFYQSVVDSAAAAKISLHNYKEFWWWWSFNYVYDNYHYFSCNTFDFDCDKMAIDQYQKLVIGWYYSDEYRNWSLTTRATETESEYSIQTYKQLAKDYIYRVDHNPWYRDHKIKIASSRLTINKNPILKIEKDQHFLYFTKNY